MNNVFLPVVCKPIWRCPSIAMFVVKPCAIIVLMVALVFQSVFAATQATYYVDPASGLDNNNGTSVTSAFKTIVKARNVVRTINTNMTGDIIVNLAGGLYTQDSTLRFSALDCGTNNFNIIYQANVTYQQPIISGGVLVTGWTMHDATKNIYKATVGTMLNTRQLYVNGVRAIRARSATNPGWTNGDNGYSCPSAVASWGNIQNVEVVQIEDMWYNNIDWFCWRGPIQQVSGGYASLQSPYKENSGKGYLQPGRGNALWVENAYELLDTPMEWYLNRSTGVLYYMAHVGENMLTTQIIAAKLDTLVSISNTHNIQFKNIGFMYATWLQPSTSEGFAPQQADVIYIGGSGTRTQMPQNVKVDHSSNLLFDGNTFSHLGASGLGLLDGCKTITLSNNIFKGISGSGIVLGNFSKPNPSLADLVKDITITNNLIDSVAMEYLSSCGIFGLYTEHTVITHNEICNLPYTGISMGYGWSTSATAAKNNEVKYNHVHDVMQLLADGAGIYFLSNQQGSVVSENYVHDMKWRQGALYPDQGSCYETWDKNVCANVFEWIHLWYSDINNMVISNTYTTTSNKLWTPGANCQEINTVLVTGGNWPAAAQAIIANAGRTIVPKFTSNPQINAYVNVPYSYTLTANASPTASFTASGLPSWLTLNATAGVLSGTPASGNIGTTGIITLTATNTNGTDQQTFQIVVTVPQNAVPQITSMPSTTAPVGLRYAYKIITTGYPVPVISVTGLPSWLTFNSSTNVFSGVPTASGVSGTISITVTNNQGNAVQTFAITSTTTGAVYEAEDVARGGQNGAYITNDGSGWSGTGYVSYNSAGFIEWDVSVPVAGNYTCTFTYATNQDRPMSLIVNGSVKVGSMSFPVTGSWNTSWRTVVSTQQLNAGKNTIRLTTVGSNGPSFDKLTIATSDVTDVKAQGPVRMLLHSQSYTLEFYSLTGKLVARTTASEPAPGNLDRASTASHTNIYLCIVKNRVGQVVKKIKHITIH